MKPAKILNPNLLELLRGEFPLDPKQIGRRLVLATRTTDQHVVYDHPVLKFWTDEFAGAFSELNRLRLMEAQGHRSDTKLKAWMNTYAPGARLTRRANPEAMFVELGLTYVGFDELDSRIAWIVDAVENRDVHVAAVRHEEFVAFAAPLLLTVERLLSRQK